MIHSFVGDLILHDLEKYSDEPFKKILPLLNNTKTVVNLESPFVDENCDIPLKNKVTLCQNETSIRYLNQLKPDLISLSNNHINDYGNESIELTKRILKQNDLVFFGAG
jgi:poly-gamma-glutamate synthesis protein (capsule biosynthesis protein)